jgi:hypothetical protein
MRRDELIQALENVRRALSQAKIYQVITASLRSGSKSDAGAAPTYQAYATFMTAYASFGEAEKRVMEALKLTPLTNPEFWTKLLARDPSSAAPGEVRLGAMMVRDFFPDIEKLLSRSTDMVGMNFEDHEKSGQPVEARKIRFFVREPGEPSLTVKHFGQIMESIENLHNAITTIYDLPPSELVVGALDSGSDKEFDLLGIAKAVKILSETLLEGWNRYRSAKATDTSVSYKTALEGITVLEKLQLAQQNNSLSAETAESLRRTIVKSIDDLFSNGVYTDAMEGQTNIVPSALPVERRKLLTHVSDSKKDDLARPDHDDINKSDEEDD